jgi:hypothetical protein
MCAAAFGGIYPPSKSRVPWRGFFFAARATAVQSSVFRLNAAWYQQKSSALDFSSLSDFVRNAELFGSRFDSSQ